MEINKTGGNTPFHGRMENSKSPEDKALAKTVLNRPTAPLELEFTAAPGAHPLTQSIARVIFGANG